MAAGAALLAGSELMSERHQFWLVAGWPLSLRRHVWYLRHRLRVPVERIRSAGGDLLSEGTRRRPGLCWASELEGVDQGTVRFHVRDYCDEDRILVQKPLPFLTDVKAAPAPQTAAPAP